MRWNVGKLMRNAADFVFPTISPFSPSEIASQQATLARHEAAIDAGFWSIETERALEQAQRIADGEAERRRVAESKASTYLAVLAALVPVILSIEASGWEKKTGPAPDWLRLTVLVLAIIYTAAAGRYAVSTLRVTGFHTVGVSDLSQAWRNRYPLQHLIRFTLHRTRRSQDAVNAKVTLVKLTHMHLIRAFACFIVLLLLDPIVYAGQSVGLLTPDEKPVAAPPPVHSFHIRIGAGGDGSVGVPRHPSGDAEKDKGRSATVGGTACEGRGDACRGAMPR
ncbi:MAG TPA: hypothetical protein VK403_11205 [Allosphingosinicella sp.]|nr:hypothetical protein [Allosphingosinicella sp.]